MTDWKWVRDTYTLVAIPTSTAAFRDAVRSLRNTEERSAFYWSIRRDHEIRGTKASIPLYERRLLQFIGRTVWIPKKKRWAPHTVLESGHEYAWMDLVQMRSREFARMLRVHLKLADQGVVAAAAEHLAWIANDQDIPALSALLRGRNAVVCDRIVRGATFAAFRKPSPKYLKAMWLSAVDMLRGKHKLGRSIDVCVFHLAELMQAIDRRAALAFLKGSDCIRSGNPALPPLLIHLESEQSEHPKRYGKPIDPSLLWRIFDDLRSKPRDPKSRLAQALAEDILALAADGDPIRTGREAKALLKLDKSHDYDRSALQKALRRCQKLPDAPDVIRYCEKHPGKLPASSENVARVYELFDHVNHDGLSLYFHNLGEHWKAAQAGLKTLGLTKAGDLLGQAARVLGPKGPPLPPRERKAAWAKLTETQQKQIEKLDVQLRKHHTTALAAVDRYIAKNAKMFAGVK